MKKKIVLCCLFVVMTLLVLPIMSANSTFKEQPTVQNIGAEKQGCMVQEKPDAMVGMGYLLIHVFTYTPGIGIQPYQGATVNVRGFLYSYNGTTDEGGDCLFNVHTKLFRAKLYFVKVSIFSQDRLVTKRDSIYIQPRQILYKEFLFVVL
ncbi:MAG: hypothetical protein IMZ52_05195 [Actinobacteria bacterium]|nr:hypothetical protein [Actinomycetota bacterium]